MAALAVTNTFVAATTVSASQVNTNFSDIVTFINNRDTASSEWTSLAVTGNGTIGGTLIVTGATTLTAGSTPNFTSSETAIGAAASTTSVSHGLSAIPRLYTVSMRCKTAEFGYSVGDEVLVTASINGGIASIWANATTIGITMGTSTGVAGVVRRDTFATQTAITAASWKYVFRAWL